MSPQRHSVPPAQNLTVLSADLLAVAAKRIVEQLACSRDWEPMQQLKAALDTYESVRLGQVLRNPDPQCMQLDEPAPATQRSEVRHV
jgi:hypothetical protein